MSVLLLGIGNSCMGDDGIGPYMVRRLQCDNRFPSQVTVVDGGTRGLELLPYLVGVKKLVVVDAVRCGQSPGTIVRLAGDKVPRIIVPKLSMNETGLPDLLAAAELLDILPQEAASPSSPVVRNRPRFSAESMNALLQNYSLTLRTSHMLVFVAK